MEQARILLVEDDVEWLEIYMEELDGLNCDLVSALTVDQALYLLSRESFAVVVADLRLFGYQDEFGGFEVLRRAKEIAPDTLVIIITAYGNKEIARRANYKGAYDYIDKPKDDKSVANSRFKNCVSDAVHAYLRKVQWRQLQKLRKFLTKCFLETELHNFCFDTPAFRPVYEKLRSQMGKEQVIQHLMEFARRRSLLNELLAGLRQINPRDYETYFGPTEMPEMMASPEQEYVKEQRMADPYSMTWALMVMEKATEFLFNQAGEMLKARREKQKEVGETPASQPLETANELPVSDSQVLMTTLEEQLVQLEKQSGEVAHRMRVREVESLIKQVEDHHRNKLMYEEEVAKLPSLDDRLAIRRRIEDIDSEIAQTAGEMRQILEQLSQRRIYIPALDE